MKYLILITTLLILFSCSKGPLKVETTLIKDCTGSYLRMEGLKDHFICNDDIVADIENNTIIDAEFILEENCENDTGFICEMFHEYSEIITITKIK